MFMDLIVDFIKELEVEFVVSLGVLFVDVLYTWFCLVMGSVSDQEFVERFGFFVLRYEGLIGIVGVFYDGCC